ncbi:MAG: amidohydrolase family protein [Pseudohongiellaceae bacterium]
MKSVKSVKSLMLTGLVIFSAMVVAQEPVLVLQGGTLIDGTGRAPIEDAMVVVQGERIRAVGRRGDIRVPEGATVIQTDGQTILPGLVDMHLHLQPWKIPMYLPWGVTTAGDLHANTPWVIAQRSALKAGVMQGPHLFVSGARVIGSATGNSPRPFGSGFIKDVEEARLYVRYLHEMGVDHVKVDSTITDEQLEAIIDEAWNYGLPVLGHLNDIDFAMSIGMKEMEHLPPFLNSQLVREGKPLAENSAQLYRDVDPTQFSPLINKMAEQGVIVDIALYGWIPPAVWQAALPEIERLQSDPGLAFIPDEEKTPWTDPPGDPRAGSETVAQFMTQYLEAGGKLTTSSDGVSRSRIIPGFAQHLIMEGITVMGVSPMAAIQASTLWPAEALGIEENHGSVEVGKVADFLIIEGDPLTDIAATRNIRLVIQDGEVVDTGYDPDWVNPIPYPASFR